VSPDGITWGVGCWQTHVLADLVADVEAAEKAGFDFVWYGNEKLHPDMSVGLTAAALHSSVPRIGTFIADPYSLHPAMTAAMIATVDHYSRGRAVLIFGAGGSGLNELGIERRKPVEALSEAVQIVRDLLRGGVVEREEALFPARAQLHFPSRSDIPIWIATRGERMLELAGRVADGVMIGTIAQAREIGGAVERIRVGAEAAGRRLEQLTISARVDVVVNEDRNAARDALRSFVAGVLSASYPDRGFVERAGVELPAELEDVCRTKNLRLAWASGHLVPDDVVDAFTWAGTAEDGAVRIAAAVDVGVDNVTEVFHPAAGLPAAQLLAFSESVVPRVDALLGARALVPGVQAGP
jgi:5,10-methylenetetrahydromethanopterin reductase